MLLFSPPIIASTPPPTGSLAGYSTITQALKSGASAQTYNGTVIGALAGSRVLMGITILGESGANQDAALWTVTLGGAAANFVVKSTPTTLVMPVTAIFELPAPSAGDLALSVATGANARGCVVGASIVTGGSVIVSSGGVSQINGDSTSITSPNGKVPAAAGNVIWGCASIKSGGSSGLSVSGGTIAMSGNTGGSVTSNHSYAHAWTLAADTSPISQVYSWTPQNRSAAVWVELGT